MQTTIKNARGIQEISMEALLHGQRIIYLSGMVNGEMAESFARQVMLFALQDAAKPVRVFLSSSGGEVDAGMIIYDIIQTSEVPLELYCIGQAYSMAALIFASGRHGRYMLPHSKVMLHEPLVNCAGGGKTSSIRAMADQLMTIQERIKSILSRHTGQTEEALEQVMHQDSFFDAAAAVDFGLADGIKGFGDMTRGMA